MKHVFCGSRYGTHLGTHLAGPGQVETTQRVSTLACKGGFGVRLLDRVPGPVLKGTHLSGLTWGGALTSTPWRPETPPVACLRLFDRVGVASPLHRSVTRSLDVRHFANLDGAPARRPSLSTLRPLVQVAAGHTHRKASFMLIRYSHAVGFSRWVSSRPQKPRFPHAGRTGGVHS
jgi:hypothetical protein